MQRPKLTNSAVEKFPSTEADRAKVQATLWCGELKGFGVRWSKASNVRAYFLQYRVRGSKQERIVTIGRHNDPYRVEQARAEAIRIKAQMVAGTDPVLEAQRVEAERKANAKLTTAQSATLQAMLDHYIENHRTKHQKPLRETTKHDYRSNIEGELKDWLQLPVSAITRDMVEARFLKISARPAKQAANLVAAYLRAILNHAAEQYANEDGSFSILQTNPVTRALKKVNGLHKQTARTRRIPLDRVGHVWYALRKLRSAPQRPYARTATDLVAFRMLTGLRLTESGSLLWSQLNFNKKTIQLLADVNKTHLDAVLPMSEELYSILLERSRLPRDSDKSKRYVFPSPKSDAKVPYMLNPTGTMDVVIAAIGPDEDGNKRVVSAHDFRRTLLDVAKACKVDADDRRKLLTHAPEGVHGRNYDNSADTEQLRPAAEAIAQYIVSASNTAEAIATGANIVKFPQKQA